MLIIIFIILLITQMILAYKKFLTTCKAKNNILPNLVFVGHHLLDVYVFFGILLNSLKYNKYIHSVTIILILIHWVTNNYECILTTYLNELCGYSRDQWFDNLINRSNLHKHFYYIHSYWILIALIINSNIFIEKLKF